jgi:hypothetical protein
VSSDQLQLGKINLVEIQGTEPKRHTVTGRRDQSIQMAIRGLSIAIAVLGVNFPISIVDTLPHRVFATADIPQLIIDEVGVHSNCAEVLGIRNFERAIFEVAMLIQEATVTMITLPLEFQ